MTSTIKELAHLKIPLHKIIDATDNFSNKNIIGRGGFGIVYRGKLEQHGQVTEIAARRLDRNYRSGDIEFWTEVSTLSSLSRDYDIVDMIGFCDEEGEKIIINRHYSKGSLSLYIRKPLSLNVNQRLVIAEKVCQVVFDIHVNLGGDYIIHRNINNSAILLDENLNPKLSGFEFSIKQSKERRNQVDISEVIGTKGYMDPAIEKYGGVSEKSDIYSVGVVLFELLCGRKAYEKDSLLAPLAKIHYEEGTMKDIIHPDIWDQMDPSSFKCFSKAAYSCLQEDPTLRPEAMKLWEKLWKAKYLHTELINERQRIEPNEHGQEKSERASSDLWQLMYKWMLINERQRIEPNEHGQEKSERASSIWKMELINERQRIKTNEHGKNKSTRALSDTWKMEMNGERPCIKPNEDAENLLTRSLYKICKAELKDERLWIKSNEYRKYKPMKHERQWFEPNEDSEDKLKKLLFDNWKEEVMEKMKLLEDMKLVIFENVFDISSSDLWKVKKWEHLRIELTHIQSCSHKLRYFTPYSKNHQCVPFKQEIEYYDREYVSFVEEAKNTNELPKRRHIVTAKMVKDKDVFLREIEILNSCRHPNIQSFLGFYENSHIRMLFYKYVSNNFLYNHLDDVNLDWGKRLRICIDVAQGLDYLHNGLEDQKMVIHGDISSKKIELDDLGVKIVGFENSVIFHSNQNDDSIQLNRIIRNAYYMDPEYVETGKPKKEFDVFSFGVVMSEILCGSPCVDVLSNEGKKNEGVASLARCLFDEGTIKKKLAAVFKKENYENNFVLTKGLNEDSIDTFIKITDKCLAESQNQRPEIKVVIKELHKALSFQENHKYPLRMSFNDIKLATQNFNRVNCIGGGGFGLVYRGNLHGKVNRHTTIVVKKLNESQGQGKEHYYNELNILYKYNHENVISLVGYSDETDEKLIVYEYASKGSLDKHLDNASLTWRSRLNICIDVVTGLNFLHEGIEGQGFVIHRDIKSANILLFDDWKAKIGDFGLSLISTTDKENNFTIDRPCGTKAYLDPTYLKLGLLTTESDVYSLGVTLFEILYGRETYKRPKHEKQSLLSFIRNKFENNKQNELVFEAISEEIMPRSLTTFLDIVSRCLNNDRDRRPPTRILLTQLKKALEFQDEKDEQDENDVFERSSNSKADVHHHTVKFFSLIKHSYVWFNIMAIRVDFVWKDVNRNKLYLFLLDQNRDRIVAVISHNLIQKYEEMNLLGGVFAIKHFQVDELFRFNDEFPRFEEYILDGHNCQIIIDKHTEFHRCTEATAARFPVYPSVSSLSTHANDKSKRKMMIDVVGKISTGTLRTLTHQFCLCELILYDLTCHEMKLVLFHNSPTFLAMLARGIMEKWTIYVSRVKLMYHGKNNILISTGLTKIIFKPDMLEARDL